MCVCGTAPAGCDMRQILNKSNFVLRRTSHCAEGEEFHQNSDQCFGERERERAGENEWNIL